MLILTYQEKLIILISCLVFVVLSAIIMACKLAPFCWLYKYCPFKARYDDDDDDDETSKINFLGTLIDIVSVHKDSLTYSYIIDEKVYSALLTRPFNVALLAVHSTLLTCSFSVAILLFI